MAWSKKSRHHEVRPGDLEALELVSSRQLDKEELAKVRGGEGPVEDILEIYCSLASC